jgi:hypothetical protein
VRRRLGISNPRTSSIALGSTEIARSLDSPKSQCSIGFQPVFCRTERCFDLLSVMTGCLNHSCSWSSSFSVCPATKARGRVGDDEEFDDARTRTSLRLRARDPAPWPRDVQNGRCVLRSGGDAVTCECAAQRPRGPRPGKGRPNRPTNLAKAKRSVAVRMNVPDWRWHRIAAPPTR